jgi:hypothetical protein
LYVLGLNATSQDAPHLLGACCFNGAASCCGSYCFTTTKGCEAG